MKANFSFGKNGIEVEVAGRLDCQVVTSRCARALDDVNAALDAALDHPIGCEPLETLAAGKKTGVGFALWRGANDERAGIKAFSIDWAELELEG